MAFVRRARGRKSKAMSDRSGFEVPYTSLKTTWDGLRVEPEEWEPKHPQLEPPRDVVDAVALFDPRPDTDPSNVDFHVGYNYDPFLDKIDRPPVGIPSFGVVGLPGIKNQSSVTGLAGTGRIGTFATGTVVTGVAGTGALGSFSVAVFQDVRPSGVAGTGALGSIAFGVPETGVAGTGAIGTEVPNNETLSTGVAGTGGIGTSTMQLNGFPAAQAGTGAIGTHAQEIEFEETGVAGTGAVHILGTGAGSDINIIVDGVAGVAGVGLAGEESAVSELSETGLAGTGGIGTSEPAHGWGDNGWGTDGWGFGL